METLVKDPTLSSDPSPTTGSGLSPPWLPTEELQDVQREGRQSRPQPRLQPQQRSRAPPPRRLQPMDLTLEIMITISILKQHSLFYIKILHSSLQIIH